MYMHLEDGWLKEILEYEDVTGKLEALRYERDNLKLKLAKVERMIPKLEQKLLEVELRQSKEDDLMLDIDYGH